MRDVRTTYGRSFPELGHFDSAEVARFALTDARRYVLSGRGWTRVFLLAGSGYLILAAHLVPLVGGWIGLPALLSIAAGALVYAWGCNRAFSSWIRRPVRQRLRQWLVQFRVPICLGCGYDLRGQTEPRCPECGEAFDPALLQPTSERSTEV